MKKFKNAWQRWNCKDFFRSKMYQKILLFHKKIHTFLGFNITLLQTVALFSYLTLSRRRSLSYRNQSIDFLWIRTSAMKELKLKKFLEVSVLVLLKYNPFMQYIEKWPNRLKKFCGVNTARFFKYVWPFLRNMHKKLYNG